MVVLYLYYCTTTSATWYDPMPCDFLLDPETKNAKPLFGLGFLIGMVTLATPGGGLGFRGLSRLGSPNYVIKAVIGCCRVISDFTALRRKRVTTYAEWFAFR